MHVPVSFLVSRFLSRLVSLRQHNGEQPGVRGLHRSADAADPRVRHDLLLPGRDLQQAQGGLVPHGRVLLVRAHLLPRGHGRYGVLEEISRERERGGGLEGG